MSATLLIEIGTEELPPKALPNLSQVFASEIEAGLAAAQFSFTGITAYASPRRLAVSVSELEEVQPDRVEQRRGPAVSAAFDANGEPTKAALGFARSCDVPFTELGRQKTEQGEWLSYASHIKGQPIGAVVQGLVERALASLPIPKRMRWGAGDVEFVRPAHWIVVLYGSTTLACEILGLNSGRTTRGHRFHHGGEIELTDADSYAEVLAATGYVVASFAARRQRITDLIAQHMRSAGGDAVIKPALLDEVTALVEWPTIIAGSFDEHYLALPEEALIASMQDHQKYFPVRAANGKLSNRFITISNIESREPDVVRDGNERVIRPRLSDADFFYRTDRATPLASRLPGLGDMLFEKRLGSLLDKSKRVQATAAKIAEICNADPRAVARAAELSRCDLLAEMVGEFPELQGVMGSYYAAADGESETVCKAIGEFYYPRFAGDDIPSSATGRCIAIADRLDSLVGIFGIGSAPTGDKDPYALRRAALGALRILIESEIDLDLAQAIAIARAGYGDIALAAECATEVYRFMRERLRGYYQDRGIPADVCTAVLANDPTSPTEIMRRIAAVVEFRALDAAAALAAANKRIANILRKLDSPSDGIWTHEQLREPAEIALAGHLDALREDIEALFQRRDYTAYLQRLAGLRESIDQFFEQVMVMSEDLALRHNRLALLAHLHQLFTRVADIAHLHDS